MKKNLFVMLGAMAPMIAPAYERPNIIYKGGASCVSTCI